MLYEPIYILHNKVQHFQNYHRHNLNCYVLQAFLPILQKTLYIQKTSVQMQCLQQYNRELNKGYYLLCEYVSKYCMNQKSLLLLSFQKLRLYLFQFLLLLILDPMLPNSMYPQNKQFHFFLLMKFVSKYILRNKAKYFLRFLSYNYQNYNNSNHYYNVFQNQTMKINSMSEDNNLQKKMDGNESMFDMNRPFPLHLSFQKLRLYLFQFLLLLILDPMLPNSMYPQNKQSRGIFTNIFFSQINRNKTFLLMKFVSKYIFRNKAKYFLRFLYLPNLYYNYFCYQYIHQTMC